MLTDADGEGEQRGLKVVNYANTFAGHSLRNRHASIPKMYH